jgi:hypothetical protein
MSTSADDERLVGDLLNGQFIEERSGWSHRFLEPDSPEEQAARLALVRLLMGRAPLSDHIRERLASLFVPIGFIARGSRSRGNATLLLNRHETRQLVFKNRAAGAQPEHARDITIANDLARKLADGVKLEAAIREAMDRFRVKRPTVLRAWKAHGEPIALKLYVEGRFHGKLPKIVRDFLESHASDSSKSTR